MGNQSGKYQQQNQGGKPKKNVHWKSAERPSPPGRPMLVPHSEQQADVVSLFWERPKIDGGSPIIGYVVEHRRMGSPHWVRATPTPVTTCEVSISGLEPGWRYQFRAIAENIVGRSEPSELSDPLTVTLQRNAISVPRFIDELQDTLAIEDERIEFRVRVLGQPQPEISWFKDGYEIFSSRRTKIVNDNDASVLIIHQLALTDEGEIRCTATNRAGHVVTKAKLMVFAPPKIRLPRTYEDGLIVEADETVRLKVGIAGQPAPNVTWRHEGELIENGGRYEIIHTDKNSLLKIDNIERKDRGEYSIRVSNRLGEDITSFLVTVTARPNPPGKVRLNMSFGKSATLSWTAPIDDGGCKIGNYIVEYFRVGWNVWLKAATTRSLSTTLNDLIEGSEYKFRVKAENPYGLSDPGEESDVLFIPDPKRGITKPKSATKLADSQSKPTPPRRKTLSPPRPQQQDAATETPKRVSPNVARKSRPQVLDNEDLHREMSYGTPDQVLKMDVRKSPSLSSADSSQPMERSTLRLRTESVKSHEKSEPNSPPLKKSVIRSVPVTPAAEKVSLFSKSILKPRLSTPEHSVSPELSTPALYRNRSLSPIKPGEAYPLSESPTPETKNITPGLERSTEPIKLGFNQNVRRLSEGALSLAKDAPSLSIAIALSNIGMTNNNNNYNNNNDNVNRNDNNDNGWENRTDNSSAAKETKSSNSGYLDVRSNSNRWNNGNSTNERNGRRNSSSTANPTIQISAPPAPTATDLNSLSPPVSPLADKAKHDDVHTSNEFMLVLFDKNSKVKDKDKQDSLELDLEDAIQPPPISISTPDLASLEFNNLHSFPLRRSVSSTELLYERAMARFYEAVELEEAEKSRKLKISQDKIPTPTNIQPTIMRKRLGSMTEAERLSFERRSELRRQSSDIVHDFKLPTKWSSRDNIAVAKPRSHATKILADQKRQDSQETDDFSDSNQAIDGARVSGSFDLGSDYTESTASSEGDSIENFKKELLARTHSPSPRELETYHPRSMASGVFTPYRGPEPEQAVVVLNRPSPLPSPDFVPKPILKRSSNENMVLESSPPPTTESLTNEKPLDLAKGIKSFFKRDKKSTTEKNTEENENMSNTKEQTKDAILAAETETKRRTKEEEERKRLEAERIMLEEAKVAADHYSELVRQVSTTNKYHTPLYLDKDELKKAVERAKECGTASDDNEANSTKESRSPDPKTTAFTIPQASDKPRLSISERAQMKYVRDTASDMALVEPRAKKQTDTSSKEEESFPDSRKPEQSTVVTTASESSTTVISETYEERPDARGRTRLVKVKRIIKRRVPSGTRSRDASSSRAPSSMGPVPDSTGTTIAEPPVRRRLTSRTRSTARGESKSPGPLGRSALKVVSSAAEATSMPSKVSNSRSNSNDQLCEMKAADQMIEEAHENVRSAISYTTDMMLFVVACYVYLFKDARLVLPILALLIYRQLGEALSAHIPHWIKRKKD